jgi:ferric-dicitrate binding protein FerR (iron transport regulator)
MNNGNEHKIPIDLISRFLSGEATGKESDALNSWIEESPENAHILGEYRKIWEQTGILQGKPSFDLDEEWAHFRELADPPKKENQLWNFLAGPKFFGSFYRMAAFVAVGLILGYSIYFFGKQFSTETFYAKLGKENVQLPDGSIVTLNKDAEITYPGKFSSQNRLVNFKGEGFFSIEKDSLCPFIIRSGNLSIRVLGTSFNVKASSGSTEIEVIVNTGTVALYEGSDRKNETRISAGQKAVYIKELKKISISDNINPNFLAWQTGKIDFRGSSLVQVLDVLSSVYHKTFIITSEDLINCRLTVSFDNQELGAVLKVLEATLDIHFTVKGEIIELSGQGC